MSIPRFLCNVIENLYQHDCQFECLKPVCKDCYTSRPTTISTFLNTDDEDQGGDQADQLQLGASVSVVGAPSKGEANLTLL